MLTDVIGPRHPLIGFSDTFPWDFQGFEGVRHGSSGGKGTRKLTSTLDTGPAGGIVRVRKLDAGGVAVIYAATVMVAGVLA